MKKLVTTVGLILCGFFILALILNTTIAQTSTKKDEKGKPIPENVVKIAEKSCVKCHTEPGNAMALAHVNISKWDSYSAEKQAEKAKAMCNMVTKGKMPPKNFREQHPEGVPSAEEVKTICDWANSIQVPKK